METIEALEIIGAKNMGDIVRVQSTMNLLYFIPGLGIEGDWTHRESASIMKSASAMLIRCPLNDSK